MMTFFVLREGRETNGSRQTPHLIEADTINHRQNEPSDVFVTGWCSERTVVDQKSTLAVVQRIDLEISDRSLLYRYCHRAVQLIPPVERSWMVPI